MSVSAPPVLKEDVPCRFCGDKALAVGRWAMSEGCVCYPDDREQDLCAQHAIRATPLGDMVLLVIYRPWFFERHGTLNATGA